MSSVLWNDELKRPMLIDFERARIVQAVTRPALLSLSANKKRKRLGTQKHDDPMKYNKSKGQEENHDWAHEVAIMKKDPRDRYQARVDMGAAWNLMCFEWW